MADVDPGAELERSMFGSACPPSAKDRLDRIRWRLAHRPKVEPRPLSPPPRYDAVWHTAMATMDEEEGNYEAAAEHRRIAREMSG